MIYAVSDIHGYYTEMISALTNAGFFEDKDALLVVCGDLLDRGTEALKVQSFILELMEQGKVQLVRGNHEDLLMDLIQDWHKGSYLYSHHIHNGTVQTALQLTNEKIITPANQKEVLEKLVSTPFIQKIIPSMTNSFEINNLIFVHGWIPCVKIRVNPYAFRYEPFPTDYVPSDEDWKYARWMNGMEAWQDGVRLEGKTIICGHWHASYGHCVIEKRCSEFGADADFSPFYDKGIIAIDACTAVSKKVNCIKFPTELTI